MNTAWMAVLAQVPLFRGLAAAEIEQIVACLEPQVQSFAKHRYIGIEGEALPGIGIVLAGTAVVVKDRETGSRVVLTMLQAGDMFGEMAAFSAQRLWPASVVAQSECTIMLLVPDKITGTCNRVCHSHKVVLQNILVLLSERALALNRKVEYLALKSMRAKIAMYILDQYRRQHQLSFVLPVSRNELAEFLHVSRTALSRELGRMRDEGLLDFYRSSIKIKDLAALQRIVPR